MLLWTSCFLLFVCLFVCLNRKWTVFEFTFILPAREEWIVEPENIKQTNSPPVQ